VPILFSRYTHYTEVGGARQCCFQIYEHFRHEYYYWENLWDSSRHSTQYINWWRYAFKYRRPIKCQNIKCQILFRPCIYGVRFPPIFMLILIQHVSVLKWISTLNISNSACYFNLIFLQFQHVSLIDVNFNIEHVKFKWYTTLKFRYWSNFQCWSFKTCWKRITTWIWEVNIGGYIAPR
jgi:hypothetical protein